ncbi:MAG: DUF58 domain-containing protein [Fimbriimonas sp.]
MVPTKRFWLLVAIGIPLAAISALIGSPVLVLAYDGLLLIAAIVSYYLAPSTKGLTILRTFDPVLSVRAANKVTLEVDNESGEVIQGRLRDEPPAFFDAELNEFDLRLESGRPQKLTYTVRPTERGSESFRGTFLRLDCPLGLVRRDVYLSSEQPVRVYPNVLALREFDMLKQHGRLKEIGIRRSRMRGLGTDFESLREYTQGDDYRKMDWKASARSGKLVVRQFEQERNQAVVLCIDTGRHMLAEVDGVTKLDHVLDALLMLTHAALVAGDSVGLLVFSDTVKRYIPPRKGRSQAGLIIEAVHDLVPEPVESDPGAAFAYLASRWTRRSLLVGFTDYEDEDRARDLLVAFKPMSRRHLALLVRVQDPRLDEVLAAPIANPKALYMRAAASMLMEDRMAAKALLRASGIHNLESEPQDLAASLVNYYLMVKERSLL